MEDTHSSESTRHGEALQPPVIIRYLPGKDGWSSPHSADRHTAQAPSSPCSNLVGSLRSLSLSGPGPTSSQTPSISPASRTTVHGAPTAEAADNASATWSTFRPVLRIDLPSCLSHGEWNSQGWVSSEANCGTSPQQPLLPPGVLRIPANELTRRHELGRGFYGRVWLADWRGQQVAVKELGEGGSPARWAACSGEGSTGTGDYNSSAAAATFAEASKLAQLQHTELVLGLVGVVDTPGCHAMVTEYMPSGSLRSALQHVRLNGSGEGAAGQALKTAVALAVARGMQHLHACGFAHLDLKPDNLLCDFQDLQRPVVKIGDVGLCERLTNGCISGGPRGTLTCMAPEAFHCTSSGVAVLTEKADVYSMGMCLLEIWQLCSRPLYGQELHSDDIMAELLSGSLRPELPAGMDPRWVALIESCWQHEPSERPSFAQLVSQLQVLAHSL